MIDLNVRVLTDLSLRFVESLARHRGGILNVASIASFIPGPGMSVYNATKAYVISFSEGLRRELRPKGIRVTALCPGPVPTEFQARAGIMDVHYPKGFEQCAADVALQGYRGLMRGRGVVVPGAHNKIVPLLPRFFSRGFIADMVYKRLRRWVDALSGSHFVGSVSSVCEIVGAFCWLDGLDERADVAPHVLDSSLLGDTHPMFDLGEGLLDRVEIG